MCYFFQGFNNKGSVILNDNNFHIIGETGFSILQNCFNIFNSFNGVSIRGKRYGEYSSFTATNLRHYHVITRTFFDNSNIFKFKIFAANRTDNYVTELFRSFQTTLRTCGIGLFLHGISRSVTDGAYCCLNVLSFNSIGNIINGNTQGCHFFRIQPNTDRIFRCIFCNRGYTFYALNCVNEVRVSVSSEEHTVISTVRRNQTEVHNGFCRFFSSSYTVTHNFRRHGAVSLGYAVLYFYGCNVSVFIQVELNVQFVLTIRGTYGAHIKHVFNATYFLLNSLSNSFFYGISTSTYISSFYCNTRLSNIRILCNR